MKDYTQRQFESELSKLVIDLVWSATDGGCKLKESDFSHFEEPLYEWTELVNKFSTSIAQAEQEMMKRVLEEIDNFSNIHNWHEKECRSHFHNPRCGVVGLRRKIQADLLSSLDPQSSE